MTQIDYTSRDFAALRSDLIQLINYRTDLAWDPTDFSDLGNVLVEAFAYMGDIMSHYIDRAANETTVDTAIKTETLINFGNLYGYKPSGPTPATVSLIFTNVSANTVDLPLGTQVMAPLSYGPFSEVYFETTSSHVGILPGQSITVSAVEGKTVNTDRPDLIDPTYNKPIPANVGLTTGLANQSILLPFDTGIIDGSLTVYIGQSAAFAPWTYVSNLLEQQPEALVFTTTQNTDGTLNIIFGDNVNGAVPPANQLISAIYKKGAGAAGNVVPGAITEVTFVPGNVDPQVTSYFTVTNSVAATGGADADNQTQIKKKIKAAVATRGRAVTLKDYENLAVLVPQVGRAKASGAYYSAINLYIQSQNDPSSLTPGVSLSPRGITAISSGHVGATVTSGYVTYTTDADHGYVVNDYISISGISPSGYNATNVQITNVPTSNTFVIANSTTTAGYVSGGTVIDPQPTSAWNTLANSVSTYLADKIPVGTTLTVLPPAYIPVYMTINLTIAPAQSKTTMQQSVYTAILGPNGLFAYDNNPFNRTITVSQVITTVQSIPGIVDVSIGAMNIDNLGGVSNLAFSANQIPYLTIGNLNIPTPTGGV
jgi:hypothetical protein